MFHRVTRVFTSTSNLHGAVRAGFAMEIRGVGQHHADLFKEVRTSVHCHGRSTIVGSIGMKNFGKRLPHSFIGAAFRMYYYETVIIIYKW